jgi:hypothetical protein
MKNWASDALREEIIDEEMYKTENPDMTAGTFVYRNLRCDTQFHMLGKPDDPRVHRQQSNHDDEL